MCREGDAVCDGGYDGIVRPGGADMTLCDLTPLNGLQANDQCQVVQCML